MSFFHPFLNTLYLSFGISLISNIPWSCIFLITQRFGIRLYDLREKETCQIIQKKINKWSSHLTDNGKSYGYSIGFWYIMSISITNNEREGDSYKILMIATEETYDKLIEPICKIKEITEENAEPILNNSLKTTIYDRCGSYYNIWLKKRSINISNIKFINEQQNIIDKIKEHNNINEHTVVFLHGSPGSGKSMIGLLLSSQLNGCYCNNLIPWQPGDTLSYLYSEVEPTKEKPLILVFEEIDIILMKIHNDDLPLHKNLPISVHNKTGWNNLMDAIQRGMYPHLIVILTSNKSPKFINELDTSYIRKGRVDITFELKNEKLA